MRDIGATHPVSELAMPPIRVEETKHAEIALCPAHGSAFPEFNLPGKVYYCPQGGMAWRAAKPGQGMNTRLRWPRNM